MLKITKVKDYWLVEREDGTNLKGSIVSVSFSNEQDAINYAKRVENDIEKQIEYVGSGYPVIPPSPRPIE